jgi:hypothetical protein
VELFVLLLLLKHRCVRVCHVARMLFSPQLAADAFAYLLAWRAGVAQLVMCGTLF